LFESYFLAPDHTKCSTWITEVISKTFRRSGCYEQRRIDAKLGCFKLITGNQSDGIVFF